MKSAWALGTWSWWSLGRRPEAYNETEVVRKYLVAYGLKVDERLSVNI